MFAIITSSCAVFNGESRYLRVCLSYPSLSGGVQALRFLVVREINCGDWLGRGYMPAHQHCDLFYPLGWGSDWVYHKLGNAPVHGSKPLTRSKISEISQWQKCFSELIISNPRISCTLHGVRRSSWKVVWVTKSRYASETSFKWQIFCSCSWRAVETF